MEVVCVAVARSQNLVTHMVWEIPSDERLKFAAAKIEIPDRKELNDLRKRASAAGQRVTIQKMDVRLPE